MKLIKAIIRPEKLHSVLHALYEKEIHGITVTSVQGHGGESEPVETYRGAKFKHELTLKVALEIGVSEPFVETTIQTILNAAKTGKVGDGKIFILPVEKIYRIRTGEEDTAAVTPIGH